MLSKKKKCIVCRQEVLVNEVIKKHQSYFCKQSCLEQYEKLLKQAQKAKLDNCC